ncbi:MAG TPA: hypothetical protein VFM88_16235 [Vicinamibacteria bacterium]|nr:hypothetical protein [Vicinamibacteria bacterium]
MRNALALLVHGAAAMLAGAQEATPEPEKPPRFIERISVERVLLDLRIVDSAGKPLLGLGPMDVAVSVDGTRAVVDSLRWVSGSAPYAEGLAPEQAAAAGVEPAPAGRLVVFLFQKDISESSRITGLMRMKTRAARLLDSLEPEDRVAVLSFDTHLRLWTDFTRDRGRLRRIVERSILMEEPPQVVPEQAPSLLTGLDPRAARRAASPEEGLLVLARALLPLPGTKSVAFFGWGLGELSGGRVAMRPEYDAARKALKDARAIVFSLDVTDADYHDLEIGLEQVAEDTGGFYVKTHDFPELAMARLEGALAGYYSLSFEKPFLPSGVHAVEVRLVGRRGEVLTSGTYVD